MRCLAFANGLSMWSNWGWEYRLDGMFLTQSSGPALIERYHWVGDGLNLLKLNNDTIAPAETQSFTYDDAGRLLTAVGPYGSRTFTYDNVGNRLSEAKTVSGTTTSQSYTYPATSNRLTSITQAGSTMRSFLYDAAGSQTSDTRSGTAYTTVINNAGRISQLSVAGSIKANYSYDGRNRLSVRQTLNMTPAGTTHLIHDVFDHVIVETNGAGQAVREYVWLGDIPVAVLDGSAIPANPTLLWVHVDHLGRPELMTDATKAVKWKALYEPFGTVHSITGAAALQMRFPGQWFQLEAGLAYNWWRHYDSTTGRYTQADPLGLNQGPQAPASIIQSNVTGTRQTSYGLKRRTDYIYEFNTVYRGVFPVRDDNGLYAYGAQSPVLRYDPNGLFPGNFFSPNNSLIQQCGIVSDLEAAGGGPPVLRPTPKGAPQFIFPNGMKLRFDINPGTYRPGQGPHINLEAPGGGPNIHIPVSP